MTAAVARPVEVRREADLRRIRAVLSTVATHAIAIAVALCFLLPLLICLVTSLMTQQQAGTGALWPSPFAWHNFTDVFHDMPFARDLWNTVLYAGLSTIGVLLSSVPVAYALARMSWRGREVTFMVVLATMMIPAQVTSLPLYVVFSQLGWVDSLKPLIIPSFFGDAFSIFLLRQFFLTIPSELTEAAKVDGAADWRILRSVVIPISKPAIAAVGLFAFLYAWNDFYNPLLYTGNSSTSQTLAVGLTTLAKSSHQNAYQLQMAASIIFLAPILVLFFFAQKVFVEGVTLTGVKG
ncbi:carbohydrate ABC transporter permease [Jatrophihabitans telluris]|uniref:Carbohydrate ABC transporter permease n=1 Tax=Jatrophihabitans telluris TaxID=2038343 RepID=A0ABY4QZV9_9ACTN|nr:carbohydrate ABC transporter permease [Jatrophihabitans telluris]UQX89063.1 carbohydrate ABC transporter permease [Jatrophihabitans telluris]